jgi:ariadne-1
MDVDDNSQSEEEYEYMYSDDDDASEGSGDDEMEEGPLEMEADAGSGEDDDRDVKPKKPKESRVTKKRKSTGRNSSLGGVHVHEHAMRDNESGIRMMDSKDLIPDMKQRIQDISEILNIPPSAACPILRSHKWAKERLFESYSTENDKNLEIQKASGVLARCQESQSQTLSQSQPQTQTHKTSKCGICFDDDFKPSEMLGMPCGHEFCIDCWKCFIQSKIDDGPACILATCPEFGCDEVITEEEVLKAAPLLLEKFENYQLRNFVEVNGTSRWCPGPGCERIAALQSCSGIFCDSDNIIANCDSCLTKFCIKCGDEPHQPLNCRALESWKEKCKNESETANWILANTKPCPNCRSRIEKNQGCNHMNCQKCKHEF